MLLLLLDLLEILAFQRAQRALAQLGRDAGAQVVGLNGFGR